jgi:DNA-binding MurR/RpiR family transcriptional regulator
LDTTLSEIIDHVIAQALAVVERGMRVADEKVLERAVEAIGRQKSEGSATHEAVP